VAQFLRLTLVGVHTPEFSFEHDVENVRRALQLMRIPYPVVIDNAYAIWRAFDNHYWPALYLVDAHGRVRQYHFGEGEYERSEIAIQRLLSEAGVADGGESVVSVNANFASPGGAIVDRPRVYSAPSRLALNEWALIGEWTMGRQAAVRNGLTGRIASSMPIADASSGRRWRLASPSSA